MLVRLAVLCVSARSRVVGRFHARQTSFAQMPANVNVDTFEDRFPIVQRVIGSPSAQDHRQGLDRSQEGSSAASTQDRPELVHKSCKARL